jgi:membrane protease subunit (stomatin/prohibitin family)
MPFEKIRKLLGKERILSWNHTLHPGIVWRFPDENSSNLPERDTNKFDAFQVKIGERAVSLINNEFYEDTPPGMYWIKGEQKKGIEVIFVDQGQIRERWGIPGTILSKDDQSIGAHGFYIFRIADPKNFVLSIVSSHRAYNSEQVNEFIKGYVADLLREHMTNYTVLDGQIMRQREEYTRAVRAKCQELFSRWGLELINMEVEPHISEELVTIIKQRQQAASHKVATDAEKQILAANFDVEKQKLEIESNKELLKRQVDLNTKQSEQLLAGMNVEISKLKAELLRTDTDAKASEQERLAQAKSLETELTKRSEKAGDLLVATTNAELEIKKLESQSKADVSLKELEAWQKVEEARANAQQKLSEQQNQLQTLKEITEIQARMAQAIAMGGPEGQALQQNLEAKFAELITKLGIDYADLQRAKSSGKGKTTEIKIEQINHETKQCVNCKKTIGKNAKFCDECGTKQ